MPSSKRVPANKRESLSHLIRTFLSTMVDGPYTNRICCRTERPRENPVNRCKANPRRQCRKPKKAKSLPVLTLRPLPRPGWINLSKKPPWIATANRNRSPASSICWKSGWRCRIQFLVHAGDEELEGLCARSFLSTGAGSGEGIQDVVATCRLIMTATAPYSDSSSPLVSVCSISSRPPNLLVHLSFGNCRAA